LILTGGLVASIVLIVLPQQYNPAGFRGLLPAASVFLAFGLYRAISAFMQIRNTKSELSYLLEKQHNAIDFGEVVLSEFAHIPEIKTPERSL
jgi:hypothetical protein